MGSIPVGFFFLPRSRHVDEFTFHFRKILLTKIPLSFAPFGDPHAFCNNSIFCLVEMCYEASKKAKKKYFAIQFFGECWVSDTESYKAHGPSTNCWNGVGRDYDNYVYEALW